MQKDKIEKIKTGTTTLGIVAKDCIVLASDKRMTAGNFISGGFDKVIPITDNIVITIAGVVSDIQLLIKYLKAEIKLKEIQFGRKVTVKEAANLLATWTYSILRSSYGICHFLVGGMNHEGGVLYDVSPDGSILKRDRFVSSGSGSVIAYGVLELNYKKNMPEKDAVNLAVDALNSAIKRDNASGQGIEVFVINKNGYKKVFEKDIPQGINR